ncbi:MAG: hypothetical protein IMX00_00570 [Limnochordales bacterium]|nr:hypothetical protein [Limnochordales bacterium]
MRALLKLLTVSLLFLGLIVATPAPAGAMTLGTHFIVGAGLAHALADNEWEAFALGLASHMLLDAIPHDDRAVETPVITALLATLFAYQLLHQGEANWRLIAAGGVAGMFPDAEHALKHAGVSKRSYYPSHSGMIRQPRAEMGTALAIELGISFLAMEISF